MEQTGQWPAVPACPLPGRRWKAWAPWRAIVKSCADPRSWATPRAGIFDLTRFEGRAGQEPMRGVQWTNRAQSVTRGPTTLDRLRADHRGVRGGVAADRQATWANSGVFAARPVQEITHKGGVGLTSYWSITNSAGVVIELQIRTYPGRTRSWATPGSRRRRPETGAGH